MKRNALEPDLQDLPKTIPIFPLNGALLLPGGRLPLNIFEPRYLAMVADALQSSHRLIGMAISSAILKPRHPRSIVTVCYRRSGYILTPKALPPIGTRSKPAKAKNW
jgi:hypothetical protein